MTRRTRLLGNHLRDTRSPGVRGSSTRSNGSNSRRRAKSVNLSRSSRNPKRRLPLQSRRLTELYRPRKKPVTLRLDADVLAWFKKGGPRYQTRINGALRRMMERATKRG